MNRQTGGFDLTDPGLLLREDVLGDPTPLYDLLRREAPVWRIPGQDSYLVADPALIRQAVSRSEDFSSNLVSVLHRHGGDNLAAYGVTSFGDLNNTLATADPPAHTRHRRLLQPHLSPAAIGELAPVVTRIVDEQLAPMLAVGRGDFVTGMSDPVPARAICEVIGLPEPDAPRLITLVATTGMLLDGVTDLDGMEQAAAAALELLVYSQEQLDDARERPSKNRIDLLSVLVDGIDSESISAEEALGLLVLLINAGTETTASLLATAVRTLASSPSLQKQLRSNPDRIPDAIEDFLRDDGPFQFHYRWTPSDTTLGSVAIPANSRVLLMWAAANRPSPLAPDLDEQEASKGKAPHFAFGRGIHFCIGAHLARLEARIVLERLLAQTASFWLDSDHPPIRRASVFLRRHASLPVVLQLA